MLIKGLIVKDNLASTPQAFSKDEIQALHAELGLVCSRMKAYHLAAAHLLISMEISEGPPDYRSVQTLGAIGTACMRVKDWDRAKYYYQLAIHQTEALGDKSPLSSAKNNMGILYLEMGKPDSAIHWFEQAMEAYHTYPFQDTLFPGSVPDNLAGAYALKGEWEQALSLYQRNQRTFAGGRPPRREMQAYMGTADMYLQMGRPDQALADLNRAEKLLPSVSPLYQQEYEQKLIRLQIRYGEVTGDQERINQARSQLILLQDSLLQKQQLFTDQISALQAELQIRELEKDRNLQQLQLNEKESRLTQLKQENQLTITRAFLLVLLLLSIGGVLVIRQIYRSRTLQKEVDIKRIQTHLLNTQLKNETIAKENLELKMAFKEQDLTNFALDNHRKRDLLKNVEARLKTIKTDPQTRQSIKEVLTEMMVQLQGDEAVELLQSNAEEVNSAFRSRLLERFPNLTDYDLELCAMVRLGMQIKEIAALRNISEGALQQARKRLRKKLELEKGGSLGRFLKEV